MKEHKTTINMPIIFSAQKYFETVETTESELTKTKFEIGAYTESKSVSIFGSVGRKKMRSIVKAMENIQTVEAADIKSWCVSCMCVEKKDFEMKIRRVLDEQDIKNIPSQEYCIELRDKYDDFLCVDMTKEDFNDVLNTFKKALTD